MGLKFVNKGSIIVDCYAARHSGIKWTLVNNIATERIDCMNGRDAVEKLRDACVDVKNYLDKLEKAKDPKEDDKYSERVCFVNIKDTPALLNLLDASDHCVEWDACINNTLSYGDISIVRIDYKSDRQLLFQEGDKVVFRDEESATPEHKEEVGLAQ